MDGLLKHVAEIISFIAGALSGSLATVVVKNQRARGRGNVVVDQSKSQAGGDIVGRDKTTG